jgi:hypothetical protein
MSQRETLLLVPHNKNAPGSSPDEDPENDPGPPVKTPHTGRTRSGKKYSAVQSSSDEDLGVSINERREVSSALSQKGKDKGKAVATPSKAAFPGGPSHQRSHGNVTERSLSGVSCKTIAKTPTKHTGRDRRVTTKEIAAPTTAPFAEPCQPRDKDNESVPATAPLDFPTEERQHMGTQPFDQQHNATSAEEKQHMGTQPFDLNKQQYMAEPHQRQQIELAMGEPQLHAQQLRPWPSCSISFLTLNFIPRATAHAQRPQTHLRVI